MKKLLLMLAAVAFLTPSAEVSAWGRKGHETIAALAERNLTPRAKKRIESFLDGHSIVYYAKWMDEYRRTPEYSFTSPWHVAPVNDDNCYTDELYNPKTGNAIYGLELAVSNLEKWKELSDSAVNVNLKYIIHLVGDMHCPSHIKYLRYNMSYKVKIDDHYYDPHTVSIHYVWDNGIIDLTRIWSVSEWAEELDRGYSKKDKAAICGGTPRDWFHESADDCEIQFELAKPDQHLGQDFLNASLPLVESQVRKAGFRLASLLNRLFD